MVKYALIGRDERHGYLLDALRKEGHEVKMLSRARTGAWRSEERRVGKSVG